MRSQGYNFAYWISRVNSDKRARRDETKRAKSMYKKVLKTTYYLIKRRIHDYVLALNPLCTTVSEQVLMQEADDWLQFIVSNIESQSDSDPIDYKMRLLLISQFYKSLEEDSVKRFLKDVGLLDDALDFNPKITQILIR